MQPPSPQGSSQVSTPAAKVKLQQANPVIRSVSLSGDEKPLSSMSVIPEKRQPQAPPKPQRPPPAEHIEKLRQLQGYQQREQAMGVYYGQIVNEKKHGYGLMVYRDGRVCEGEWQNDRKYGECHETYENGDVFHGTYVNGKQQGFGVHIRQDGEKYDGEWMNGFKHGKGKWLGPNGDTYDGDWNFGKIDGQGTYVNADGDWYQGNFRNNLKHGRGIEHFKNGDVYNGEYVNGRPEGEGMYLWANGNEFRGQFKSGHRHGKGKWVKWVPHDATQERQSYSYEGDYENDKKHGQGVFNWPSGNYYKGAFLNDFRHGYGEMYWVDGSHYKGNWEKGCQHGEGELYKRAQAFKRGYFENNVLVQQKRPESSTKQATKLVWQKDENERLNMSCMVLDRNGNPLDISMADQPENKSYQNHKDARNNFMPSIAKKPAFLLYRPDHKYLGKAKRVSDIQSFHIESFEEDPDFSMRPNPKRLTKARLVNHFYSTKEKQPTDLTFSLRKAFVN